MPTTPIVLLVKRNKTTFFVETNLQDNVRKLKQQISRIINKEKEPKEIKIFVTGKAPGTYAPLDDHAVLEQAGLVDESVVYMAFLASDGGSEPKWETIHVPEYEKLHADGEDLESVPPSTTAT